jgi:hypothetical protein
MIPEDDNPGRGADLPGRGAGYRRSVPAASFGLLRHAAIAAQHAEVDEK